MLNNMNREQLKSLIQNSELKLANLKAIEYDGLKEKITELESVFKEFKEGGENLLSEGDVLQIGIVGQVKAGKSSFLNSLFFNGEDVLPKASTPMTAGLTVIEYADKNTFEVEYFNSDDWKIFVQQDDVFKKCEQEVRAHNPEASESIIKKEIENRTSDRIRSAHEMVSTCGSRARQKIGQKNDSKGFTDIEDLQNVLEQYVGANGEYTSVVKSLYIKMKDERLKGLRIVDTPGVNDPVVSRENRTRTFLHSCHGVFLLSASTDFLGSGDVCFLNARIGGSGIGTVVILASKFDSVLQDLGAEREMKQEERGDLADIADFQTKKFKKRLRELSDTIDEKLRGRIKLDTTAGIGYSIAHKPADKWDNVEKQVVQQMKRYYPDYFSTDADIKETFESLSNIADIKERYLDDVFMQNKDTIIAEKVENFFAKNKEEISSTIGHILDEFKNRRKLLDETTVAEIQKQKDRQSSIFKSLKKKFKTEFEGFSKSLQNNVKNISNDIPFQEIRTIPTEEQTVDVEVKGKLWGTNTKEVTIKQVNSFALRNQIETAIDAYLNSWNDKWGELFKDNRDKMFKELTKIISDAESEIMSSSFDDRYYRDLITQSLKTDLSSYPLDIDEIRTKYKRHGDDAADKRYDPSRDEKIKELDEKNYIAEISRELNNHKKGLIEEFRSIADSIKHDLSTEVQQNLGEAIRAAEKMKNDFAEKLTKEGEEYLAKLEKDMTEKSAVLKQLDNIISCISELSTLYR